MLMSQTNLKSLIRIIIFNHFFQIAYSVRNRSWVFWYYSNNGQNRNCENYCILVFSIVGGIILLMILCACLNCYRIRNHSKSETLTLSFSNKMI